MRVFFWLSALKVLLSTSVGRIQILKMRCYRRNLNVTHTDYVTNEKVLSKIKDATRKHDDLSGLTIVMKRKLRWFDRTSTESGMTKIILQRKVKGTRKRGRQRKRSEDNIKYYSTGVWKVCQSS